MTVTVNRRCIFVFTVAGSNPHSVVFFLFFFLPCKLFSSNLALFLICILENETIAIVSSSFIVIHTKVHFKSSTYYSVNYLS